MDTEQLNVEVAGNIVGLINFVCQSDFVHDIPLGDELLNSKDIIVMGLGIPKVRDVGILMFLGMFRKLKRRINNDDRTFFASNTFVERFKSVCKKGLEMNKTMSSIRYKGIGYAGYQKILGVIDSVTLYMQLCAKSDKNVGYNRIISQLQALMRLSDEYENYI